MSPRSDPNFSFVATLGPSRPFGKAGIISRPCLPLTAIAALSAKAYSHNSIRVHRHLCPARKAPTGAPQAAGMDAGLYGRARRDGSKFYLGPGKRTEGNLHSQS